MKEESIRARLKRTARPAIFLRRSGLPVPMDHPAHSYLGGLPKLPPHIEWPYLRSPEHPTVPLHFVAQVDLSKLPKFQKNPLPRRGTLYFFVCAGEILGWLNGSESKVLYYEGSARRLPAREPPPDLPRHGLGKPWPWLRDDEPAAKIGFKHPLSLIRIKSYFDRLEGDDEEIGLRLQHQELHAKLPLRKPGYDRIDPLRRWPFAWHVIEHTARAVLAEMAGTVAAHSPAEQQSKFQEISTRVHQWLERARGQPALRLCDTGARKWFNSEWQWLRATVENTKKIFEWRLDLDGLPYDVTDLTCYTFAAHSEKAARRIPAALVRAHEEAMMRDAHDVPTSSEPIHQMLGYGASVQSAPTEHLDDILLLQIAGGRDLAWFHTLGCVLQIWISRKVLRVGRLEPTMLTVDCD